MNDPAGAIASAFQHVGTVLRERLHTAQVDVDGDKPADQLAVTAANQGLITEGAAVSVSGLAIMDNLARQGMLGEVDQDVCRDFCTLVEATLVMLDEPAE